MKQVRRTQKSFVLLIGLVVQLGFFVGHADAKDVKFIWSGRTIDDRVILQFAYESYQGIIEEFRREGIKVILLEKNADIESNRRINLPEDFEAVRYYTKHFDEYLPETKEKKTTPDGAVEGTFSATGRFLPPYSHNLNDQNQHADAEERPYVEKPLMLIRSDMDNKSTLIHEYLHFYLRRHDKPEKGSDGKLHNELCLRCQQEIDLLGAFNECDKKLERAGLFTNEEELLPLKGNIEKCKEEAEAYYLSSLTFRRHRLVSKMEIAGEEMDIEILLYNYRNKLNIQDEEKESLASLQDYLAGYTQELVGGMESLRRAIQRNHLELLPDVERKVLELRDLSGKVWEKFWQTQLWLGMQCEQEHERVDLFLTEKNLPDTIGTVVAGILGSDISPDQNPLTFKKITDDRRWKSAVQLEEHPLEGWEQPVKVVKVNATGEEALNILESIENIARKMEVNLSKQEYPSEYLLSQILAVESRVREAGEELSAKGLDQRDSSVIIDFAYDQFGGLLRVSFHNHREK
ncbi:MAG: hypothetical protein HY391_02290 [Deltaproteobacteria bacterium]|nr:hypothetical protein [Deltaproteobacteria bacterium]